MSAMYIWGPAFPFHDCEDWPKYIPAHLDCPNTACGFKIEGVSSVCEWQLSSSKQKHSKLSDPGVEAEHLT